MKMTNAADIARFALAGNAVLTINSNRTGARYTFSIKQGTHLPPNEPVRFVALLSGPDNTEDFVYVGMIKDKQFRLTRKSKLGLDSPPVRAIKYFCDRVLAKPDAPLPAELEIRHVGKCGRCGRPLTVPESIDTGLGPDCRERMGIVSTAPLVDLVEMAKRIEESTLNERDGDD